MEDQNKSQEETKSLPNTQANMAEKTREVQAKPASPAAATRKPVQLKHPKDYTVEDRENFPLSGFPRSAPPTWGHKLHRGVQAEPAVPVVATPSIQPLTDLTSADVKDAGAAKQNNPKPEDKAAA